MILLLIIIFFLISLNQFDSVDFNSRSKASLTLSVLLLVLAAVFLFFLLNLSRKLQLLERNVNSKAQNLGFSSWESFTNWL